jgi:NAD-dependent dihydropyrimidine dehydrogenase PreA subunit
MGRPGGPFTEDTMIQKSVILNFPSEVVDKPVLCTMIRMHDIEVNILQAYVSPEEDGKMFAIIKGDRGAVEGALGYLNGLGVRTIFPAMNLVWDEKKCVHCGACIGQCLPKAFYVDEPSRRVVFDGEKCIACELCVPACFYGAIEPVGDHLRRKGEL